jgi:hypothetical protein
MALYPSGLSDSARKSTFDFSSTTTSSATERARTRLDDFLRSGSDGGARRVGEPASKSAKTDDFELRQLKAKVRELEAASLNHRAQTLKVGIKDHSRSPWWLLRLQRLRLCPWRLYCRQSKREISYGWSWSERGWSGKLTARLVIVVRLAVHT